MARRRRAGRWRRLGGAEAAARCGGPVPSVVDVLVIMQVEQSSLYAWMVPEIQQPPVCDGGVYPQCKLCRRQMRSHRCCSWCVDAPVVVQRLVPGRDKAENCEGSQLAVFSQGGRCPCCAGRRGAAGAAAVMDVAVIMQRRWCLAKSRGPGISGRSSCATETGTAFRTGLPFMAVITAR